MPIEEIRAGLYRLDIDNIQCYVWRDRGGVTMVDACMVGAAPRLARMLGEVGIATTDVKRLVLTHFHHDHAGAAADIAAWGDVEVIAGAGDAAIIRGEAEQPKWEPRSATERELAAMLITGLAQSRPCRVDREVVAGDVLDIAGGAEVISGRGHTEGSIGLFLGGPRVLFTGDVIANNNNHLTLGPFNLDADLALESFRTLAAADSDVACFGHGDPLVSGAREKLAQAAENPFVI